MQLLRTLFVVASLVLVVAGLSAACTVESAFVSGKLVENGGFEIVSALDSQGNPLDGMNGKVFSKVESGEGVVLPASASDELVYVVADIDFDNGVLRVASSTHCAATAEATVASAKAQKAGGSGCCASKAASAKSASAQVASTKNASVSNASSCGSYKSASAPASCSTSKANVKTASAGSSCSSAKAASAEYAAAKSANGDNMIIFTVSGMTCGGCASKIEAAVAALEMEGVEGCEVDVAGGKATIRASGEVCTKTLESAIQKAGFTAEIVDAGSESTEDAKS